MSTEDPFWVQTPPNVLHPVEPVSRVAAEKVRTAGAPAAAFSSAPLEPTAEYVARTHDEPSSEAGGFDELESGVLLQAAIASPAMSTVTASLVRRHGVSVMARP